ncbi:MAG: helix-turn-helix domain-containing protein [Magnetovibrionaceae bacterium]
MSKRKRREAPDPIDKHVGARVRARRVGLRISQTELGKVLDVTFQQVQKYENGANRIGASNLLKIARALGCEVGFFFENAPDPDIPTASTKSRGLSDNPADTFQHDPLASREALELVHNFYRIEDPAVRKQISQLVRSLTIGRTVSDDE